MIRVTDAPSVCESCRRAGFVLPLGFCDRHLLVLDGDGVLVVQMSVPTIQVSNRLFTEIKVPEDWLSTTEKLLLLLSLFFCNAY